MCEIQPLLCSRSPVCAEGHLFLTGTEALDGPAAALLVEAMNLSVFTCTSLLSFFSVHREIFVKQTHWKALLDWL